MDCDLQCNNLRCNNLQCNNLQCNNLQCNNLQLNKSRQHQGQDAWLAQELNALSVEQRESIYDEIHAINSELPPESPEFVIETVQQLHKDIESMTRQKKRDYIRAVFLKPSLESDTDFYLMFLRTTRYNTRDCAQRICSYFTYKRTLFGKLSLARDITLEDLGQDDMHVLKSWTAQDAGTKDSCGRPIWLTDLRAVTYKNWQCYVRAIWYIVMIRASSQDCQRFGIVDILFVIDPSPECREGIFELMQYGMPIYSVLPIRQASAHFCYNQVAMVPVMKLYQILIGKENRLRFRSHFGTHLEVRYSLMTYGVGISGSVAENGSPEQRQKKAEEFLAKRRKIEEEQANIVIPLPKGVSAAFPAENDVLLGRGVPFHTFAGNCKMIEIAERLYSLYSGEHLQKSLASIDVVNHVKAKGGRFLQRTLLGWVEVSQDIAREKVSQAIRSKQRQREKTTKVDTSPQTNANGSKRMRYDDEKYDESYF